MDDTKTCETCKHFIQHYYKFGQTFRPLSVGHCTDPRCRDKKVEMGISSLDKRTCKRA